MPSSKRRSGAKLIKSGETLGPILRQHRLRREQLAIAVGVGIDTVNNWCSHRTLISLDKLDRIAAVLRERGVARDTLASFIRFELGRHGFTATSLEALGPADARLDDRPVLVIGSHLYGESFQPVTLAIGQEMRALEIDNVIYLDTCGREDILNHYLDVTIRSAARGVALVGLPLGAARLNDLATELYRHRIPCTFIETGPTEVGPGAALVRADDSRAAALAAEVQWARGHTQVGAIALTDWATQDRKAIGLETRAGQLGLSVNLFWAREPTSGLRPRSAGDELSLRDAADRIASDFSTSAAIALSSYATKELTRALNIAGRRPGIDFSLIALGCWDWMHDVANPPLSHIVLPFHTVGRKAARILNTLSIRELGSIEREIVVNVSSVDIHCLEAGTVTDFNKNCI